MPDVRRIEYREPPTVDLDREVARPQAPSPLRRELLDAPASSTHDSPELLAFYAGLHANITATTADVPMTSRDSAARAMIDAKREAYAGPYRVEGQVVSAPPMFKMVRSQPSQTRVGELAKLVGDAKLAVSVQGGQASPAEIVKATQKLLDAGKLPPGPGDVATRIKQMQWQYGVGIDCACYTRQCLAAVTGKNDDQLALVGDLGMRHLDTNAHFAKVNVTDVRPGDVMTLDPKPPETVGHNVIVRDHVLADDARKQDIGRWGPVAVAFMASSGPHHVIEVDSSWGAGPNGANEGGYRRDTWIHDESNKSWGHFQPGSGVFLTSTDGPTEYDTFHGAYRVKGS